MGKDQDLLQAVRNQDKEVLQKMLNKNKASPKGKLMGTTKRLNINVQDSDGMTGLHQAALLGDTEMMKLLIDSGAMVDIKDHKGMRPLHYAAWQGKEITTVSLLLKEGSSANEPAQNGTTPLHLACEHGHLSVVSLLLQHHGDPTLEDNEHKTPLDLACEFGRYQVVELLVRSTLCNHLLAGSLSNDVSNRRFTCLHLAARNGHVDVMRLLLQAGVDINRQTLNGTCLHEAALYGKIEAVRILLEAGIDVNQTNSYDQTALDIVNTFTTTKAGKELKHLLKGTDSDGALSPQPSYAKLPMSQCNLAVRHLSVNSAAVTDRTDEWVGRCMESFQQPAISSQHSPANSNRNSTGSTTSSCLVTQHRLSGVSYESGHSHKSYCSNSSSSVGSLDRLEESGYSSAVNVHELFQSGLADAEILRTWLADLHFDEYYDLFMQAGYDMPTIAHMTPQDLSAIGISNPKHRKQLKQEINKLYIQDGFPDYKPADIGEWLHLLGLQEYYQCLQQECATIDDVLDIECEDLEEIGITKLGHQKKIQVAIERLKRLQSNRKRLSSVECKSTQDVLGPSVYPGAKWLGVSPSGYRSTRCLQRSTSGDNLYPSSGPLELTTFQQPKEEEQSQVSGGQHGEVMGKSWPSPNPKRVHRDQEVVPIQLPRTPMIHQASGCTRPPNEPPPPPYTFYDTREHTAINANVPSSSEHPITMDDGEDTATIRRPSAKISPRVAPKPKPVAKIIAKTKQESLADGVSFDGGNMVMERSYGSLAYSCSTLPRKMAKHSSTDHAPQLYGSFGVSAESNQNSVNGHEQDVSCSKPAGKKVPPPPPPKRTNSMKCSMNKVGQMLEPHTEDKNAADVQGSPQTSELPQPAAKPVYVNSTSAVNSKSLEVRQNNLSERLNVTGTAITSSASVSQPASYSAMTGDYIPPDMDGPLTTVIQQLEQNVSATAGLKPAVTVSGQHVDVKRADWQQNVSDEDQSESERVHNTSSSPTLESSSSSGAIDTNTLPFANENVGTIKQRNPNNKTSIVTVNSSEEGDNGVAGSDNVDLNFSVFDDGMSTVRRNNSTSTQKHDGAPPDSGPRKKVPPPVSPRNKTAKPAISSEGIDSRDVLSDIDNMLQDLTDELDAMLDLEAT